MANQSNPAGYEYVDRNTITVSAYLDQWLDAHAVEIKPRTLHSYRRVIELYVKPNIGGVRLQAVRSAQISKLYRDLLASGGKGGGKLSVATVTRLHAVLRKAFHDAVVVDELLPSNPVERAKRPKAPLHEPGRVWTPAQLRIFLETIRPHRLYAFYRLAAYSGARRGELLNLRWSNVDLDACRIEIVGSAGVVAGERVEGTTKSGRSRTVTIDPDTVAVLREHHRRQAADKLLVGEDWRGSKDDYVFTTGWGEPIYPDTVGWLMTKTIRAYNDPKDGGPPKEPLPRARVHDLRHIPRHHPPAGRRCRSHRRGTARPCRPSNHAPGLRTRDQGGRDQGC